jgi:hypothetical protein
MHETKVASSHQSPFEDYHECSIYGFIVTGRNDMTRIRIKFLGDQPVKDPLLVANCKSLQGHLHVGLTISRGEKYVPVPDHRLQITLHIFKYEVQIPLVWINIHQLDDVRIMQLLQKLDLPQGCDVHAFLILPQSNLFDCQCPVCLQRTPSL